MTSSSVFAEVRKLRAKGGTGRMIKQQGGRSNVNKGA
jgi:hypothetical protein